MSKIPNRCTCAFDAEWEGECDFCLGNYPCPGGCGKDVADCVCEERIVSDERN